MVQRLTGYLLDSTETTDWDKSELDSIELYATFLQPAIDRSCARCHNHEQQKGGLRLDEPHFALAGGRAAPSWPPVTRCGAAGWSV